MKIDETERELLRLAQDLADGRSLEWDERSSTDPDLLSGVAGLRDIEVLAAALSRDPELRDSGQPTHAGLEPGSKLGRYPVEREAGRGGMGVVYLARDEVLDRPVALKLLPADVARSPERIARLTREAKLLASLNHPNVATIYGLEEESSGLSFLVLEWVAGDSLATRLRAGAMPWRQALDVCAQIASALAAAHEGGVIHRDLKPGNVMMTPQGRVKVLDFGLARRGRAPGDLPSGPSDPTIQGTWGYVSPECLTRDEDHRADVFAFGCVLYECLAGVPAFPGQTVEEIRHALHHRDPDESRLPSDMPAAVRRLIASCVAKDPDRRLGSMSEALRTIESALDRRLAIAPARSEAATSVPHRLPEERDAFVGREDELGHLARRLRQGARLVTLQGMGGMGKTRLAIRYGWQSLEEWPGGVWFCDLTEARSRDGIAAAVAATFGVSLGSANAVEQVGRVIAGRGQCLLILDNFEQIVSEAEAAVAPWLARAPETRFLVTSRERLGLPEEDVATIEPLGSEPGIELFFERSRTLRPGYEPEKSEAESVREVVRLVEGIPLAIELAAARVRLMSPAQIVSRMRERFRLLAGTGGGRHGTLRAVIDGSWELLEAWERAGLAQSAVFEGGFTLEAAEAVLDLSPWSQAPWIPDVIQSLVDRSLLRTWVPQRDGGSAEPVVRFGMFVSLQEYAREKLESEGAVPDEGSGAHALQAAYERHGRWYARSGSDHEIATLYQHGGTERRRALSRELDNLVAACRRAAERGDGGTMAAAFTAAWDVWMPRGSSRMAVALGRELAAALPETDDDSRRRLLTRLGFAESRAGHAQEALIHLESALELHRSKGDRRMEGHTLATLGAVLGETGQTEEARARLEAALEIAREIGNRHGEGLALARLGYVDLEQGRIESSQAHSEAALFIAREVGDRNFEGQILGHLGPAHRDEGRLEEARAECEAALEIAKEVGNRRFEGIMLHILGNIDADESRRTEARAHYESALAVARDVGNRMYEGRVMTDLGSLSLDQGRMEEARAWLNTSLSIHGEVKDRTYEGHALGELARLNLEQGRTDEAQQAIARGDRMLRELGDRIELSKLLCVRAEMERQSGDLAPAKATLAEAETLMSPTEIGPRSDLGRRLAKVRETLAGES